MLFDQRLWLLGAIVLQWILLFILMAWMLIVSSRFKKIRNQLRELTKDVTKGNFEALLKKFLDHSQMVKEGQQKLEHEILGIRELIKSKKGNVGVYRFHAFDHEGSDLSFSIAVIDDHETGFVLTSIFGREESRVYAKPLEKGKSTYHLTQEEIEAIERAKKPIS